MNWYNREYDRFRGIDETPRETLRQKKLREEYSELSKVPYPVRNLNLPPLEHQENEKENEMPDEDMTTSEIVEDLTNLLQNLNDFNIKLKEAEKTLHEMRDFLRSVSNENAE